MGKIKPQIKKNNPSKSNYSNGWNICPVCLIGEIVSKLFGGNKKDEKNNP